MHKPAVKRGDPCFLCTSTPFPHHQPHHTPPEQEKIMSRRQSGVGVERPVPYRKERRVVYQTWKRWAITETRSAIPVASHMVYGMRTPFSPSSSHNSTERGMCFYFLPITYNVTVHPPSVHPSLSRHNDKSALEVSARALQAHLGHHR